MSAGKSPRMIKWSSLATILGLIAAFASAGAAIYVLWIDKHSDVVLLEQGPTTITPQVCYNPPTGSGIGLGAGGYWLYFFVDTTVKLSNRGAQPVAISSISLLDEKEAQKTTFPTFTGRINEVGASAQSPGIYPVLAVGEVHTFHLSGNGSRYLGSDAASAESRLIEEWIAMPFAMKWVLKLSDLNTAEIPVQAKQSATPDQLQLFVMQLVLNNVVQCNAIMPIQ